MKRLSHKQSRNNSARSKRRVAARNAQAGRWRSRPQALDERIKLLKVHLPDHESDHVLNLATQEATATDGATTDTTADPDSLATLLLGGVRLVVREWRLDGCRWSLAERGRRLVAALTNTLNEMTRRSE